LSVAATMKRIITRHGLNSTWWKRTRGSKDSVSGHSAETWTTAGNIKVMSYPLQSNLVGTGAGDVSEERYEVYATTAFNMRDRVEYNSEEYVIEGEAQPFYYKGDVAYYRHLAVKLE
jgi:hypothetical protein